MIIKKKILSNEIINKKNTKHIALKDKFLFHKDLSVKTGDSFSYFIKDILVLNDGKIFTYNYNLISEYLAFNSLSKFIFIKKIVLLFNYILQIFFNKIFFENIVISKNFFIVHNRNSKGYFHWITDTLPKIIYGNKVYKNFTVALPHELKINFIISSLKRYKIKFFFFRKNKNYFFKKVIYIGNLYPSGSPRSDIIKNLNKSLISRYRPFKKIYISRNKSDRRKLINEKDLIKVLKLYNFEILHSEKLSFNQQVKIFSTAKFVLGLHGAGLSNIIWMKKKTMLLELKPEKDLYLNCYFNLSNLLNINYRYIICKKMSFFGSSKNSNYILNINLFKMTLKKLLKK